LINIEATGKRQRRPRTIEKEDKVKICAARDFLAEAG